MIKEVHLKKDLNLVLTSRPFHGSAAVFPSAHKDAQPVTAEISSRSSMSPFLIHPCKALSVILWLVALHSFIVGLGLILMPPDILKIFGFDVVEKFFSAQGGVFHIVVCMIYIGGAIDIVKNKSLIQISIAVKFIATFFLLFYYFIINDIWIVLFSGLGDFLMGLVILLILKKCNQELIIQAKTKTQ